MLQINNVIYPCFPQWTGVNKKQDTFEKLCSFFNNSKGLGFYECLDVYNVNERLFELLCDNEKHYKNTMNGLQNLKYKI